MFGSLPVGFDPSKLPSEVSRPTSEKQLTKEQEAIKKAIRFMAINKEPDGTVMVGFADFANPKDPVTYYLKAGESQGEWTVREADSETAVMTIVNKEGVEVTLTLGGDSSKALGAVSPGASAIARTVGSTAPSESMSARPIGGSRLDLFNSNSLRGRRQQRDAQAAAEKAAREADRDEQRRQLQDIRDEILRMREAQSAAQPKAPENEKITPSEKEPPVEKENVQ